MIAGESVTLGLAQVGVAVAQINREDLPGPADADAPGGVIGIRNTIRIVSKAAQSDRAAVEPVAGAEAPVTDFAGHIRLYAVRPSRERILRVAAEVDAI